MIRTYLQAVAELATLAGHVAYSFYGKTLDVIAKADGSPVTLADRSAEEQAREWIEQHFPDDGILGEEFGTIRPEARRRWIIDPIDGTKSFIRTVPLWGTLVAVTEGEHVLAGCAYFPAVNERIAAAPGEGCWWNDTRCQVSSTNTLSSATALVTDDRFQVHPERIQSWQTLTNQVAVTRSWGDCYGYLLVATGRAEIMVDDIVSPWDAAALQPIITEAGGVFTDWRGVSTAFGADVIATNAALAAPTRDILRTPA